MKLSTGKKLDLTDAYFSEGEITSYDDLPTGYALIVYYDGAIKKYIQYKMNKKDMLNDMMKAKKKLKKSGAWNPDKAADLKLKERTIRAIERSGRK